MTKPDERLWGVFPPIFNPGDLLEREVSGTDTVLFRLLKPAEAPLVKASNWRGKIMGVKRLIESAVIASAIRADRDAC